MGPSPALTEPRKSLIPTVLVATAKPWPAGTSPTAAPGFAVTRFADGLLHPRGGTMHARHPPPQVPRLSLP